jgi:hypothetical protein
VRPGWKQEVREKGMTQFALLEKEFPLDEKAEKELLADATKRFEYDDLLAEQQQAVDKILDRIRAYVDAPGRRYRVHHSRIFSRFKWKPAGPVFHVPESLERELVKKRKAGGADGEKIQRRRLVWAGGIRRFEKGGLVFETEKTPVIFGSEYIEWIDPDPAPDDSDMRIESGSEKGGEHVNVKIKTDGFALEAPRARVEWSKDLVNVYPAGESNASKLASIISQFGVAPDLSDGANGLPPKVRVLPGSLAEKAGIRSGDRVVALNGRPVNRPEDVLTLWPQLKLDKGLRVSLDRAGKRVNATFPADVLRSPGKL